MAKPLEFPSAQPRRQSLDPAGGYELKAGPRFTADASKDSRRGEDKIYDLSTSNSSYL